MNNILFTSLMIITSTVVHKPTGMYTVFHILYLYITKLKLRYIFLILILILILILAI